MDQDEQHLRALSICHYVLGGIGGFFSCMPLIHMAVGIALVSGSFSFDQSGPSGPADSMHGFERPMGWLFIVLPAMVILSGWTLAVCVIMAGRRVAQRRNRVFCLVIAAVECVFMPLGTILGVFTIVVLMRPSVVGLFAGTQAMPASVR